MTRLTPKHKLILRMYSVGLTRGEVAEDCGCSTGLVDRVIGSEAGKAYLVSLESELDHQFKSLYEKVIGVVEKGLDSGDLKINLAAASLWAKANGKFVHKVHTRDLTAEDIIGRILSGELRKEAPALPPKPIELKGVVVTDGEGNEEEEILH
ncbi:MAG: hypothetical protein ACWGQW_04810 [bacterium]